MTVSHVATTEAMLKLDQKHDHILSAIEECTDSLQHVLDTPGVDFETLQLAKDVLRRWLKIEKTYVLYRNRKRRGERDDRK